MRRPFVPFGPELHRRRRERIRTYREVRAWLSESLVAASLHSEVSPPSSQHLLRQSCALPFCPGGKKPGLLHSRFSGNHGVEWVSVSWRKDTIREDSLKIITWPKHSRRIELCTWRRMLGTDFYLSSSNRRERKATLGWPYDSVHSIKRTSGLKREGS